ncbi:DUF1330 domain-containing protein [Pseudoalteromonas phenolica]|uniref:DUF1330 domain-containing protein n=1 Tax=Pseudoalteromonas phenolica TaxID=161398 RepID=A0A5R9PYY0_9GAMM|nr:DUF1330 domain-containing protein [Pseudoalteromonas phenolica]TLX45337.1 DUF1330 domain-containing protein [Pseudoalteromonas phenolica]
MFEMLVGLEVSNDEIYDQYRAAMKPILNRFGGEFGYDFKVSEVLKSEEYTEINRVFTIRFSDEQSKDAFFNNDEYQLAKQLFFETSVNQVTIIASYTK